MNYIAFYGANFDDILTSINGSTCELKLSDLPSQNESFLVIQDNEGKDVLVTTILGAFVLTLMKDIDSPQTRYNVEGTYLEVTPEL